MKVLALAAVAALLLVTAALGSTASASSHSASAATAPGRLLSVTIPSMRGLHTDRILLPHQTSGTATPAPTAVPTATVSPYPDPVSLLNNAITKFQNISNVHFEDIINGDQTNVEKLVIDATGVANCSPGVQATVKGTDSVPGTAQTKNVHYRFIQKGKKYWKRQLVNDKTHKQWHAAKAKDVAPWGFSIDNPLACPTSGSSGGSGGSGGGSDTLKDMVNLGPASYHGISTWHIQATEITTDAQGNSSEALLEFFVSQDQFLPYGYKVTVNDPDNQVTLTYEQVLTKFGNKVKIAAPKVGATKP